MPCDTPKIQYFCAFRGGNSKTLSITFPFDCSYVRIVSVAVHQQHTDRPVEDGQHGEIRSGQVRGGGHSHVVPGQDPHTVGREGTDVEAHHRAAGRRGPLAARSRAHGLAVAATLAPVQGVCWHPIAHLESADGDDDAGNRGAQARQRHGIGIDKGTGEQPGERAQQPAGVGKVHGKTGLSAGRPGRQVRVQTTSVLVSYKTFSFSYGGSVFFVVFSISNQ